jgi:ubiquitin-protein ligase
VQPAVAPPIAAPVAPANPPQRITIEFPPLPACVPPPLPANFIALQATVPPPSPPARLVAGNAAPLPGGQKLSVRARRLFADAEQVRKAFQTFPLIRVAEMRGNPADLYHIDYRIRGLTRGPQGTPVFREQHVVEIQLTSEYPRQSPKCKMLTPIFHPNIEPAVICVGDHWTAAERLVDLIVRIGEMIAYQVYNIKSPLDGEAAMWADQNARFLPIDTRDILPPGMV